MPTPTEALSESKSTSASSDLWNSDLAPVPPDKRQWGVQAYASLWIAMVACVPTYLLAGGLMAAGMNWKQAVLTVFLGNLIVLIPMLAIGHMGAKYGVPFPVLLRSAFGPQGAKIPAIARSLVACGWFGINTWVGGSAIYAILNELTADAFIGSPLPIVGIDPAQLSCFVFFWLVHIYFVRHGTESIRWLEILSAPLLLATAFALLAWAYVTAGGFGEMLSAPSQFVEGGAKEGKFWDVFVPSLTGMVGFWATMALSIPDFTRFARSQRAHIVGQILGLPVPMALFAFVAVAVTSATVVIYGEAIWNPIELASRMGGVGIIIALASLILATLTTNLAANLVAPAYGFSNLYPSRISFETGGYITAAIGIAIFPWRLVEDANAYVETWLVGYSALLGPIAGVLIADYFFVRKTVLNVEELFKSDGAYQASAGWNWAGLLAFAIGVAPSAPGFLHATGLLNAIPTVFAQVYNYAWFVGFAVSACIYVVLAPQPIRAGKVSVKD